MVLPHFPVIRPEKDTTKTRIVFDASATCEDISLNDVIHQGPKLQRDLFDVLLQFRRFPVAIVCDIAEMYLRIGILHEEPTKAAHRTFTSSTGLFSVWIRPLSWRSLFFKGMQNTTEVTFL